MNKWMIIGNLTKEPISRVTADGKDVCDLSVAVKRNYSKDSQFIKVVAWGVLAKNCAMYLSKGSKVAVIGEATAKAYSSKDGTAKVSLECIAEAVEFLNWVNKDEKAAEEAMANDIEGLDFEDIGF